MQGIYNIEARIAIIDFPVLIIDGTEIGKILFAQYKQNCSPKSNNYEIVSLIYSGYLNLERTNQAY